MRNSVSGRPVFFLDCMLIRLLALFPILLISLAKAGTQVIVPFRDEDEKRHLKVMGDLGQIVPLVCCNISTRPIGVSSLVCIWQEWDMRNEQQTEECLRHSNVVYNLVGREYETKYSRHSSLIVRG